MGMYRSELFLYPPMGGLRIERSRKEPCGLRTSSRAATDNGRRVQPLLAASWQLRRPSSKNARWRLFQGTQAPSRGQEPLRRRPQQAREASSRRAAAFHAALGHHNQQVVRKWFLLAQRWAHECVRAQPHAVFGGGGGPCGFVQNAARPLSVPTSPPAPWFRHFCALFSKSWFVIMAAAERGVRRT